MPDPTGIGRRVIDEVASQLSTTIVDLLPMQTVTGTEKDSVQAAQEMQRRNFSCIVVLGGDGTCRAAAKGVGKLPMIPLSTGTNNVFPQTIESTLAGMAAAYLSNDTVHPDHCCDRRPVLQLRRNGSVEDIALVDLVTVDGSNSGVQAVWETSMIRELFLADASPTNLGLSSIGGWLDPLRFNDASALYVEVCAPDESSGAVRQILVPLVPGLIQEVPIKRYLRFSRVHPLETGAGSRVACLDGERHIHLSSRDDWSVTYVREAVSVVNVRRTLDLAQTALSPTQ
ncbi:MAG: NAD(+)/NADH kinase [Congregibacter sp.]